MADATPTVTQQDSVVAVDVDEIKIRPLAKIVHYNLRLTWASGAITYQEGTIVDDPNFSTVCSAFLQAAPRRKLLNALVSAGYLSNITVS